MDCVETPSGGSGSMASGAGGSSSTSSGMGGASGGTTGTPGSGTPGASTTTGAGGTGATTGSGGSTTGAGGGPNTLMITPLTIVENYAASDDAPNGTFGISGLFYAFADACVTPTLVWDETTRCMSGTLCSPSVNSDYWGATLAFDFNYDFVSEAKLTWDPVAYGVIGVAWEIQGTAPSLQAWVTNMDAAHGSACTADTCDIAGPPDGKASAGLSDYLLFSNMVKDDWGGAGELYSYASGRTLSLQFKLPSIQAGAVPF
jgi:hypothetical protein